MDFTKEVNTNKYYFKYIDIKYDNYIVAPNIELYRWKRIQLLKNIIRRVLSKYQVEPNKKSLSSNIENVVARLLFERFSDKIITNLKDGLFDISSESISLYNDFKTTFMIKKEEITDTMCKTLISEVNITKFASDTIHEISKMKKVDTDEIKISCKKSFSIKFDKTYLNIPILMYKKLKKRYDEYKRYNEDDENNLSCDELITCLLIRYDSLGSRGNQMGIPIQVKNRFKKCNIEFEGFSSSFNHHYKYYCSMFYDIEKYFCSLGPFQNIAYIRGSFLINPPYEINLLDRMVAKINYSLSISKEKLCFVFGSPTWDNYKEVKFHDVARNSKYYKKHYRFDDYEVWWYDFFSMEYAKIPSSTRYILANYYINIKCINDTVTYWRELKIQN